jgi:hypothetical protein
MVFVETSIFTREIQRLLPDESYRMLQSVLMLRPDAGGVIREMEAYGRFVGTFLVRENGEPCESFTSGVIQIPSSCFSRIEKQTKKI